AGGSDGGLHLAKVAPLMLDQDAALSGYDPRQTVEQLTKRIEHDRLFRPSQGAKQLERMLSEKHQHVAGEDIGGWLKRLPVKSLCLCDQCGERAISIEEDTQPGRTGHQADRPFGLRHPLAPSSDRLGRDADQPAIAPEEALRRQGCVRSIERSKVHVAVGRRCTACKTAPKRYADDIWPVQLGLERREKAFRQHGREEVTSRIGNRLAHACRFPSPPQIWIPKTFWYARPY